MTGKDCARERNIAPNAAALHWVSALWIVLLVIPSRVCGSDRLVLGNLKRI
jgi:hypothetical protein